MKLSWKDNSSWLAFGFVVLLQVQNAFPRLHSMRGPSGGKPFSVPFVSGKLVTLSHL